MPSRFALAIIAAALSLSPLAAQIRSSGSGAAGFGISVGSAGRPSPGLGSSASIGFPGQALDGGPGRFHQGHASGRRSVLLPYPYFYSDLDGNYDSQAISQPQVIVVPAAQPAAPAPPPAPRESLLIEWQGDHFVRTTMSAETSADRQIAPDYSEKSVAPLSATRRLLPGRAVPERSVPERSAQERSGQERSAQGRDAVQAPRVLPPAVLVFHDGRKEEVSEYTIMSGTIYSKADYWTTGSWTRKIQIADLNVPATLKLNQERGVKFSLPSSANEVIIRP